MAALGSSPKKPKKSKKKAPLPLPEPQHTIDVLDDDAVFEQPGNFEYPYSLAYQIRTRILELETETTPFSEVNQFNFDLLRLKVRKYHTAYREHHAATDPEISYQKMKEQHAAHEELIQCIVSPAVYESRRLAERERIMEVLAGDEAEHGNRELPAMEQGVHDTTHLFVDKQVKSFMDGKENVCAICTEHLTENEFGHVYAIESKDEKHSDHGIKCGHKYHRTCISSWAKIHMNCPLCKSTIVKLHLAKEEKPEGGEKAKNGGGGAEEKPKSPKSPKSPKGTKKTYGGSKNKTKKRSIKKKI
jgi:hypothetical protein